MLNFLLVFKKVGEPRLEKNNHNSEIFKLKVVGLKNTWSLIFKINL